MRSGKATGTKTGKNVLRIIGGTWRGRKLAFPELPGLRPTPNRVRETLFNWLAPVIGGGRCLDLFSGSGALGLEALSRGARACTLIDTSRNVTEHLKAHLRTLNCYSAQVVQANALQWLTAPQTKPAPYDIIFLDPPFHQKLIAQCCHLLQENQWLHKGSYIYIESEPELVLDLPPDWSIHGKNRAGDVNYYLCKFEH